MNIGATRLLVLRMARVPKLTMSRMAAEATRRLPRGRRMSQTRYWQIEHGEGSAPDDAEKSAIAKVHGVAVADIEWPALLEPKAKAS